MSIAELKFILTVVAAYLAPGQGISYGKLVDLLRRVCPGLTHLDVYPLLFNVQAGYELPNGDELGPPVYDCNAALADVLAMLKRPCADCGHYDGLHDSPGGCEQRDPATLVRCACVSKNRL